VTSLGPDRIEAIHDPAGRLDSPHLMATGRGENGVAHRGRRAAARCEEHGWAQSVFVGSGTSSGSFPYTSPRYLQAVYRRRNAHRCAKARPRGHALKRSLMILREIRRVGRAPGTNLCHLHTSGPFEALDLHPARRLSTTSPNRNHRVARAASMKIPDPRVYAEAEKAFRPTRGRRHRSASQLALHPRLGSLRGSLGTWVLKG